MKTMLRIFVYQLLALWITDQLFATAFIISGGVINYALGAIILSGLILLVKPILKLVFFPINALTLGLFSLIINAGIFYMFYTVTDFVTIGSWHFAGLTTAYVTIPARNFEFWEMLVILSLSVTGFTNFMTYLVK